jgi:glycosyltransferase involved in cell wall biosynthesis
MAAILRVIVDQIIAPVPGRLGRYTEGLASALISSAPAGCEVEGIVSSSLPQDYQRVLDTFPGLSGLYKSSLARRELAAAWQFGLTTSPGGGMIHAPSLFAPLRRRNRSEPGEQVVATIHDLIAWSHPESLPSGTVAWSRAMLRRAEKHADAVVVPTHALAERLESIASLGDRIRVIGTAPRLDLHAPQGEAAAAAVSALGLPDDYVVAEGGLDVHTGLLDLLRALGRPDAPRLALVVAGDDVPTENALVDAAVTAGVDRSRLFLLDETGARHHAAVLAGARAFVAPAHEPRDATPLIEAFSLGVPVVHSSAAPYTEVAADAGVEVAIGDGADEYAERLASAIRDVVSDDRLADRLAIAGRDRAAAFSWRDTAERVWQLHADL